MSATARRKPGAKPRPAGRQGLWDVIRRRGESGFTAEDLYQAVDCSRQGIYRYLQMLLKGGFIAGSVVPARGTTRTSYTLILDCGAAAPRLRADGTESTRGRGVEQIWRTMKMLSTGAASFDLRDLAIHCRTDKVAPSLHYTRFYLHHLARAGYLAVLAPAAGRRTTRYRLIDNTGARPPVVCRIGCVWDPNQAKLRWHEVPE
ncbi:MAG TPA: hypothetical protein VMU87_16125 [Stellaceae bacterium]|nr:hypothetical protein [Stellaceae bacterium]